MSDTEEDTPQAPSAQERRNEEYRARFQLASTETLVADFHCALQKSILLQGKMYISQNYVCFYSNILGKETSVVIPAKDITGVQLAKIALVIPNSIKLYTTYNTYFFASFIHREDAYNLLVKLSKGQSVSSDHLDAPPQNQANNGRNRTTTPTSSKEPPASGRNDRTARTPQKPVTQSKYRDPPSDDEGESYTDSESDTDLHRDDSVNEEDVRKIQRNVKASNPSPQHKQLANSTNQNTTKPQAMQKHVHEEMSYSDISSSGDSLSESESPRNKGAKRPQQPPKVQKLKRGDRSDVYAYPSLPANANYDPSLEQITKAIADPKRRSEFLLAERRVIYEGYLQRQGKWSVVRRKCVLFSDMFVFMKELTKDGSKLLVKQIIDLSHMQVDIRSTNEQHIVTKMPCAFRLLSYKQLPQISSTPTLTSVDASTPIAQYIVSAGTEEQKMKWAQQIMLAVSKHLWTKKDPRCSAFGWSYNIVLDTLHGAVFKQDERVLDSILLENKNAIKELDQEGNTVLHVCAHCNHASLIPRLLSVGADIRVRDRDDYSAIHIAVMKGFIESLTALLASRFADSKLWHDDGKQRNLREYSALWMCVLNPVGDWKGCLKALLSRCEDMESVKEILDQRDTDGQTLLEVLCECSNTDGIIAVLEAGASIDLFDDQGFTPLSKAVLKNNMTTVTCLVQRGAQVNLRSERSLTVPLHHARSLEVASFLVASGARLNLKNTRNVRAGEQFKGEAALQTLAKAEEMYRLRQPIDADINMKIQAYTVSMNGNHSLDRCAICKEDFSLVKQREYCRSCGWNICIGCGTKKLIFRRVREGKRERVLARVCAGCFNLVSFRVDKSDASMLVKQIGGRGASSAATGIASRKTKKNAKSRKYEDDSDDDDDDDDDDKGSVYDETDVVDEDEKQVQDDKSNQSNTRNTKKSNKKSKRNEDDGEVTEDDTTYGWQMRKGFRMARKGLKSVGGFVTNKVTNVLDHVTDSLTDTLTSSVVTGPSAQNQQQIPNDQVAPTPSSARAATPTKSKKPPSRKEQISSMESKNNDDEYPTRSKRSNKSSAASDVSNNLRAATSQASANLALSNEIEEKGSEMQEEAMSFSSFAAQIKKKNRGF